MTQNKLSIPDLIAEVSTQSGITQKDTRRVIDELAQAVGRFMAAGMTVTIPNLISLAPKTRAARKCRNPRSGASVDVPERVVVKAAATIALARAVAGE